MALGSGFLRGPAAPAAELIGKDGSMSDQYLAALKRELAGYEARGLEARAKQVRKEIDRVRKVMGEGGAVDPPAETTTAEPASEQAMPPRPRRSRKKS